MCSARRYLQAFSPPILARRGDPARQVSVLPSAAASPPIRFETIRYLQEIRRVCSCPPTAAHHGRISIKASRHARCLLSRPLAPITSTYLPALLVRASGASYWELERQRLHQVQVRL